MASLCASLQKQTQRRATVLAKRLESEARDGTLGRVLVYGPEDVTGDHEWDGDLPTDAVEKGMKLYGRCRCSGVPRTPHREYSEYPM